MNENQMLNKAIEIVAEEFKNKTDKNWWMHKEGKRTKIPTKTFGIQSDKPFWLSIKLASKCLFSRRNGFQGKLITIFNKKYSVKLRLFGKDII